MAPAIAAVHLPVRSLDKCLPYPPFRPPPYPILLPYPPTLSSPPLRPSTPLPLRSRAAAPAAGWAESGWVSGRAYDGMMVRWHDGGVGRSSRAFWQGLLGLHDVGGGGRIGALGGGDSDHSEGCEGCEGSGAGAGALAGAWDPAGPRSALCDGGGRAGRRRRAARGHGAVVWREHGGGAR